MWRPIAELKPELWQRYVVRLPNGWWGIAMWKFNSRWGDHEHNPNRHSQTAEDLEFSRTHTQPYFGDPEESDDYDMALPVNTPTHFIDVRPLPTSG